jgi:hemolysin activation/secretion protein
MTMKTALRLICVLTLLGLAPAHAQNQSYEQFAPKQAPGLSASSAGQAPPPRTSANGNPDEVLSPRGKALVFVGHATDVATDGTRAAAPVVLRNVQVPDEPDFKALVAPYVGHPLTRGKLNELITRIIIFHRRHDYPVVDVIVPPQDIDNGVIQLLLLESKVGKVVVTGNRWFPSSEIRNDFRAQAGDGIVASTMQSDLEWANQNPFHTSDIIYQPGHDIGTTDVEIQTKDRFPVRVYAGYEDTGNAETGFDRYLVGMNWGDAFGLGQGHQLNYQYTTSGNGDSLRAHSGSYTIPLPWHNNLTFFGNYVETKGVVPPLLSLAGRSYQISGRYTIPLPPIFLYKQSFSAGFDYKYNKNSLQFGSVPITAEPTDVDQLAFTYDGSYADPYGVTSIDEQLYYSPGNWGGNNNDAAFSAAHTGATSGYVYSTLELERLTKLPGDWSLFLRGILQTSNSNLIPSEQLGFGGYDTVRGYDEREVNTDDGYIFNVELRTPSVSIGDALGWTHFQDQLQFLGFWDYGAATDHNLLPGEPSETPLSSVGGGVRYSIDPYLSLRADYGFQLLSTGLDQQHGSRADVGVVISY